MHLGGGSVRVAVACCKAHFKKSKVLNNDYAFYVCCAIVITLLFGSISLSYSDVACMAYIWGLTLGPVLGAFLLV